MAAIPAMFPCIMIGNIILVGAVALLREKCGKTEGLPISIVIGGVYALIIMLFFAKHQLESSIHPCFFAHKRLLDNFLTEENACYEQRQRFSWNGTGRKTDVSSGYSDHYCPAD